MALKIIQPQGRGFGKKKAMDDVKQELESGMLTYEDVEPVKVHAPRVGVEMMPMRRRGLFGRIKDWIFGVQIKPQTMIVLDREARERLKEHMENLKDNTDMVKACGVTVEEIEEACKRVTVLARGHHIRNADGTVTDVSNDPNYECK